MHYSVDFLNTLCLIQTNKHVGLRINYNRFFHSHFIFSFKDIVSEVQKRINAIFNPEFISVSFNLKMISSISASFEFEVIQEDMSMMLLR